MPILAAVAFLCLLACGIGLEIAAAKMHSLARLRRLLDRLTAPLAHLPMCIIQWYREWRERSYHEDSGARRSAAMKWLIRGHLFIVIPLATFLGATELERLALASKPIMGSYLTPDQAWYLGALAGFVAAALIPLIAHIVIWVIVVAPLTVLSFGTTAVQRLIMNATGGVSGHGDAPFALAGAILGFVAACALLSVGS